METGYSEETVSKLLERLEKNHKVIVYDHQVKEILIKNWSKYNWSSSDKYRVCLEKTIQEIKNETFKKYLVSKMKAFYGEGVVDEIELEPQTIEQLELETCLEGEPEKPKEKKTASKEKKEEEPKKKYGEYSQVLLTDKEYEKLQKDYPNADELIEYLDMYIKEKRYKSNCHYLSIKRWVVNAIEERNKKQNPKSKYVHTQAVPDYLNQGIAKEKADDDSIDEVKKLMQQMT